MLKHSKSQGRGCGRRGSALRLEGFVRVRKPSVTRIARTEELFAIDVDLCRV